MKHIKIILIFKKSENIFLKIIKKDLSIIGIIVHRDNDSFLINLKNKIINLEINSKLKDKNLYYKEIDNIEMTTSQCFYILEWINYLKDNSIIIKDKLNFIIKFLNILNNKKSFYYKKNISLISFFNSL